MSLDLIGAVEADIASAATVLEHGVAWLVGMVQVAKTDVQKLEADSPLVAAAINAGKAAAAASGINIAGIELAASELLAYAQKIDGTSAPTTAPVAGSPADPAVIAAQPPVATVPAA